MGMRTIKTIYITDTSKTPSLGMFEVTIEEDENGYFVGLWGCQSEPWKDRERKPFASYGEALIDFMAIGLDLSRELLKPQKILLKVV